MGVGRHVGRFLGDCPVTTPFELVNDGDLLFLINRMLHLRGRDTVRISKVEGHADERMVLDGRVREVDRLGNDAADDAANFCRRRVVNVVIDARRNLSGVCGRWYPVCVGCDIVQADHAPEAGVAQGIFHGILVRHHGRNQEEVEEGLKEEVERRGEENTQEQVRMPMTMDGNEDTQTRLEPHVTV